MKNFVMGSMLAAGIAVPTEAATIHVKTAATGTGELLQVIGNWGTVCENGGVASGPTGMTESIQDCMDLAAEAGEIGSEAYERALEGCYELLCAREIIECD